MRGSAVLARREVEELRRLVDERRGDVAGAEIRVVDDVFEERNVRLDAADAEFAQRAVGAVAGVVELARPGADLHEQRIVVGRDDGAAVSRCRRRGERRSRRANGRSGDGRNPGVKLLVGIFRGDAALERVAVERNVLLRRKADRLLVELVPLRDQNLAAHQIDAGHHFGDGVLHLNARIDFDEEEFAGVGVDQEFDGARVVVAGLARELQRGFGKCLADLSSAD